MERKRCRPRQRTYFSLRSVKTGQSSFGRHHACALRGHLFGVAIHHSFHRHVEDALTGRYTVDNVVPTRREGPGEDWPNRPCNLLSTRRRKVRACYRCSVAGLEVGCETYLKPGHAALSTWNYADPTVSFASFVEPSCTLCSRPDYQRTVCYT